MNQFLLFRLAVLTVVVCSTACVPLKEFYHSPRLAENLHRLQIGQTTRGEVFQYFGPPDIEADNATSRVNVRGPLGKFWGEHFRANSRWLNNMPYSSIGEQYVTYLYVELEIKGSFELQRPDGYFGAIGSYEGTILKNKLLIRVNKNTGIVDTVSYGEQFQ